jgi:CBS domain-containing protein
MQRSRFGVQEILEALMQDTLETVLAGKGATIHFVVPEATVFDAVGKMNQERIGALLVCVSGEMVGIFTERDVLCKVVAEGRDPATTRIVDVMTQEVVTVRSTTSVEEAMAVFTERRFRHLPVVDDGELKGLVSSGDLTRRMSRNQEGHIQDLMNFITGKYPG